MYKVAANLISFPTFPFFILPHLPIFQLDFLILPFPFPLPFPFFFPFPFSFHFLSFLHLPSSLPLLSSLPPSLLDFLPFPRKATFIHPWTRLLLISYLGRSQTFIFAYFWGRSYFFRLFCPAVRPPIAYRSTCFSIDVAPHLVELVDVWYEELNAHLHLDLLQGEVQTGNLCVVHHSE